VGSYANGSGGAQSDSSCEAQGETHKNGHMSKVKNNRFGEQFNLKWQRDSILDIPSHCSQVAKDAGLHQKDPTACWLCDPGWMVSVQHPHLENGNTLHTLKGCFED